MHKIMLVDDSKVMLEVTEEILSKGVNTELYIVKFDCAEEAKNQFASFQPNLVITDIEMPKVDGYELIQYFKKMSDVPIIAISGSTLEDNNTDTLLHVANLIGADFTLTKDDISHKLPDLVMSIL